MSKPVFFVPTSELARPLCHVDGDEGRHAATVKRLRVGEAIELCDGNGGRASATVTAVGRDSIDAKILGVVHEDPDPVRFVVVQALAKGDMAQAALLLGRPYSLSGHVIHGRQLGRALNCRTLNVRFGHDKPAASGIFVARVHGLSPQPLPGVANLGVRPTLDRHDANQGQVLLETHCLEWPSSLGVEGGYGKLIQVELLHKLHDERAYESLPALEAGIQRDCDDARHWLATQP